MKLPKPSPDPATGSTAEPMVALLSGGADSCVMVGRALRQGRRIFPLYVRQGAVWEDAEEAAIGRFLSALGPVYGHLAPLRVTHLDLPDGYASQWALRSTLPAPGGATPDEAVYMPGRNLALLLDGALLAHALGVRVIQMGLLAGNPFPDSRPEFFRSFRETFALATGYAVQIETPLQGLSKAQVLRLGDGLPLGLTFSCLRPTAEGRHCGQCNKCAERRRGFAAAGLHDPTDYAHEE